MSKEAMKLALEALEEWYFGCGAGSESHDDAVEAIKQALAAPVQEPVAWMTQARNFVHVMEFTEAEAKLYGWIPVYTTPPAAQRQWIGLTDEEMNDITCGMVKGWVMERLAIAIEAKLKEKNNG